MSSTTEKEEKANFQYGYGMCALDVLKMFVFLLRLRYYSPVTYEVIGTAGVMELADVQTKIPVGNTVWVRPPSPAPL